MEDPVEQWIWNRRTRQYEDPYAVGDEGAYRKWASNYGKMLGAQAGGVTDEMLRDIYRHGNTRRGLREMERKYGLADVSGKGRTDRQMARDLRRQKGVDRKGRTVPEAQDKPQQAPAAGAGKVSPESQEKGWDPKLQVGNRNRDIAAVTDQQIAAGAWFQHSKQGPVKITREMRDWAKDFVSKVQNPMKPQGTAPKTSGQQGAAAGAGQPGSAPKAALNAAASVPKTAEQQGAAAAMEKARQGNAQKARDAETMRRLGMDNTKLDEYSRKQQRYYMHH